MRIEQGRVSKSLSFDFNKKYNLGEYRNTKKPCIFFGNYPYTNDHLFILNHRGPGILVWCGTDGLQLKSGIADKLRKKTNIKHIVTSPYNERNLKRYDIPFRRLPITPININRLYKPTPLGDSVYIYIPKFRADFYGRKHYRVISDMFPFIHTDGSTPYDQVIDLYKKSFIGLRLTPHDGMPTTAVELGLMGRRCVWNGDLPNAIPWTPDKIPEIIKEEQKFIGQTNVALADAMYNYLNIGDDWLHTDYYDFEHTDSV